MTASEALAYLGLHHGLVRFYRDETGQEMVRVTIEDIGEERITVIRRAVAPGGVEEAFRDAVSNAQVEFEADTRRSGLRVV